MGAKTKTDGRSKSLSAQTAASSEAQAPERGGVFIVTVDGREYPLDPAALSARDEDRLRAVTKSKLTLPAVMASIASGVGGLSDVAAFMYLSECQAGRAPMWDTIAGSVTVQSDIDITAVEDDDPEG